jgi:hypothetical protein
MPNQAIDRSNARSLSPPLSPPLSFSLSLSLSLTRALAGRVKEVGVGFDLAGRVHRVVVRMQALVTRVRIRVSGEAVRIGLGLWLELAGRVQGLD